MAEPSTSPHASPHPLDGVDVDVLVIGGGIVGAGVARDAAMRGLRTALVEQRDFAFGTSSRSSRLLHGGIRYLAQGRIGLVREASGEKAVLHRIAPHLCAPLAFVFPTRTGTPWTRWKLGLGVKLYDVLAAGSNLGASQVLGVDELRGLLPTLDPRRLTGAVRYFDAQTNDARLVIDTLRSATRHGARVANYTRFVDAERRGDRWRVTCERVGADGGAVAGTPRVELTATHIVNAAGPWSPHIPHSGTRLRPTKGVHLVIDRERLPVPDAVVMAEGDRILFALPWGDRVVLGTTDTDYDGSLDSPTCDAADMDYVLRVANATFPGVMLTDNDVISTWAGLRPLVADPHGRPSDISRRHEITSPEPGWIDVTGGKLTTYRLMAAETVDRLTDTPCRTADEALLPSADVVASGSGVLPPPVSHELVQHYCRHEWATHLADVMERRTSWRRYHHDAASIAEQVAAWMAEELVWSADRIAAELRAARGNAN
ncbi:MAG: FAD-dependent oxidoreductase [Phycisphaera sp.]|nr:FAD-dependent oxidoreductase [Phycisphaera sp.]